MKAKIRSPSLYKDTLVDFGDIGGMTIKHDIVYIRKARRMARATLLAFIK